MIKFIKKLGIFLVVSVFFTIFAFAAWILWVLLHAMYTLKETIDAIVEVVSESW
jgi:hypothetical protein